MANEFKIKNGLVVDQGGANITGSTLISGSLTVTEGITGSLFGTSSYAITASYALNGGGGGNAFPYTGSAEITGSLGVTGSITTTGNVGIGTSSPSYPFQISKNLADLTAYMQNTNAGSYGLLIRAGNTSTYALSVEKYDGTNISRFHGSGNVVIGDSVADTARLFVKGSGATTATTAFRIENSAGDSSLIVNDAGNVAIGANRPTSSAYDLSVSYILFDYLNGGQYTIGGVNMINQSGTTFVHGQGAPWKARFDYSNVLISGSFDVSGSAAFLGGITGSTTFFGDVIPGGPYTSNTSSYSLGSATAAWKDLYVSNGSIFFITGSTSASIQLTNDQITFTGASVVLPTGSSSPTASYVEPLNQTVNVNGQLIVTSSTANPAIIVKGFGNTSGTYNTTWYNSDNTWLAGMRDDGLLLFLVAKRIYMNQVNVGEYGTNNTILGFGAGASSGAANGGANNTSIGSGAGSILGTGAQNNVLVGLNAGTNITSGQQNVCLGNYSGQNLSTGGENMLIGYQAGGQMTTAAQNTCVGNLALTLNVNGALNTAIGESAGYANNGSYNTFIGRASGYFSSGSFNTFIGTLASRAVGNGNENVSLGYDAGRFLGDGVTELQSPSGSVYLGASSYASQSSEQNAIVIGYKAKGLGSNTVVLGNDNITLTALKGNIGIGKTTANAKLDVSGSVIITGSLTVSGSSTFGGDLIPAGPYVSNTSSYSLGSPTAAWKDLYVSNGSVYFVTGSTSASIQLVDNQITFAGAPVALPTGSITPTASYAITASYALAVAGGGPGPSSTAGGDPTQVQYNDNGSFGGVPTLVYDGTTLSATGSFTGSFTGNITNINIGEVNLNFGAAPGTNVATTTVSSTLVTKNSFINIYIMSTSSVDHNADDHRLFALYSVVTPSNIIDNTSFDVVCTTDLRVNGIFTAKYIINNF